MIDKRWLGFGERFVKRRFRGLQQFEERARADAELNRLAESEKFPVHRVNDSIVAWAENFLRKAPGFCTSFGERGFAQGEVSDAAV